MADWIIPCNKKYYDIVNAFNNLERIDWKQTNRNIKVGDIVYIYICKPVAKIEYKCRVNKVLLTTCEINDSTFVIDGTVYENYSSYMELERLNDNFNHCTMNELHRAGVNGCIQGPRIVPQNVKEMIETIEKK